MDLDRDSHSRSETGDREGGGGWPEAGRGAGPVRRRRARAGAGAEPRDALDAYVRSVGSVRVLDKEETYELARTLEREERAFREALGAIPGTALLVLERWRERRRRGLVTASLAAGYRDGSGRDWSAHVDRRLRALERLVEAPAPARGARRAEPDERIARALDRAGIAIEVLLEIARELEAARAAPRTRRAIEERRRLGLATPAARAALRRAREALERHGDAKRVFVHHNLRLVVKSAKRYRKMGVPFVDLIQEGNLGLIRAVEKFDHRRGFMFSTYAVWWIDQALLRAVQNSSRTVRLPSHIWELQVRSRRVGEELRGKLGREPERGELARALGVEPEIVDRLAEAARPTTSAHAPLAGTDDLTLEDMLADEEALDPVDAIDRSEVHRALARAIETLGVREREILELRFGLEGGERLTLQEIGDRIGLSRERVRQLERRVLQRLRDQEPVRELAASLGA